jgi:hypothetical protein
MFTNESYSVISITVIPKDLLLEEVIKLLEGREMYVDTDCDLEEKIYSGDVFEALACEAVYKYYSLDVVLQLNNLAAIIKTELIRINTI